MRTELVTAECAIDNQDVVDGAFQILLLGSRTHHLASEVDRFCAAGLDVCLELHSLPRLRPQYEPREHF